MEKSANKYMVDFTLPDTLTDDFISTLPKQRRAFRRLFSQGKLLNYAMSLEQSKLWAVFCAKSEADLLEMVSDLPLSRFMRIHISSLTFYNAFQPAFSFN